MVQDVWWLVSVRQHYLGESAISSCRNLCRSCSHFCASLAEQEPEPEESEDEQSAIFVSWRLTILAKLSVDVS